MYKKRCFLSPPHPHKDPTAYDKQNQHSDDPGNRERFLGLHDWCVLFFRRGYRCRSTLGKSRYIGRNIPRTHRRFYRTGYSSTHRRFYGNFRFGSGSWLSRELATKIHGTSFFIVFYSFSDRCFRRNGVNIASGCFHFPTEALSRTLIV